MIEQVIDRRLPEESIRFRPIVAEERPASLRKVSTNDGPQFFLSKGVASLRVEVGLPRGAEILFLGQIHLAEDLEVTFGTPAKKKLAKDSGTVTVVPDSEKRREVVKALDRAGMHHDFAAIEAFFAARGREDSRLARTFLERQEDLLATHGIDLSSVRRVEITPEFF